MNRERAGATVDTEERDRGEGSFIETSSSANDARFRTSGERYRNERSLRSSVSKRVRRGTTLPLVSFFFFFKASGSSHRAMVVESSSSSAPAVLATLAA
jgi:hypothetical protein